MLQNYEVNPTAIILSLLYPCYLSKLIRRYMREDQPGSAVDDETETPACSDVIDSVVFNPEVFENSRTILVSPEAYKLPFEIIEICTHDGVGLMGYLILQEGEHRTIPTMIFFHGNSGNIGDRLLFVKKLYKKMKVNVFMIEYRGFGFSQGHASEHGVYNDAQAAFNYIDNRPDLDSSQIVIFGRSLGGAVAIDLASRPEYKEKIAVLILENTFSSLTELARRMLPGFLVPLIKILRVSNKFKNYSKISSVSRPTLFISGLDDALIPPEHMTKLYIACKARKKIIRFYEGDHMNCWTIHGYTGIITDFIDDSRKKYPVNLTRIKSELYCTQDV